MRLIRFWASALALPLLLSSCTLIGAHSSGSPSSGSEDSPALTYPTEKIPETPIFYHFPSVLDVKIHDIGVEPTDTVYEITEPDGFGLIRVSMTLPVIHFVENSDPEEAVGQVLEETRQLFLSRIEHLQKSYLSDFTSGVPFFCTPQFSVTYTITDYSESRISLLYTVSETNADGIVSRSYVCSVIDLKAGFEVDLSTLFTAGISDKLLTLVNRALASGGYSLYPSYESVAATAIRSSWLIVPEGIAFVFSPGVIASADQDSITILLGTDQLNELLSEYGAELLGAGAAFDSESDRESD
ncbi:MAG: hypothetical protein ACI3XR_02000 [Eubacteriales bacterium]